MIRAIMHAWASADEDLRREALAFLVAGLRVQALKGKIALGRHQPEKPSEEHPRPLVLSQSRQESDKC